MPLGKVKGHLKRAVTAEHQEKIQEKTWQGKFLSARWEDDELNQRGCWNWLRNWAEAPSHTIAGIVELYEQLTPTKLHTARKVKTMQVNDVTCRKCSKAPGSRTKQVLVEKQCSSQGLVFREAEGFGTDRRNFPLVLVRRS